MKYSELQYMLSELNLNNEDMSISQELFEDTVKVNFPITHNINKFNGRYKTLNKFIDAIGYDSMEYSVIIPGPVGDQNSRSAQAIKITEQLLKKSGLGIKNMGISIINALFPDINVTIDKLASEVTVDESGVKHSFVLLDLSHYVNDIKENIKQEVVEYELVDYTKKFPTSEDLGEWLCSKFKLFPTKKEYLDHIDRWWDKVSGRDLIKKTERQYDSCINAVMDISSIIYKRILECK